MGPGLIEYFPSWAETRAQPPRARLRAVQSTKRERDMQHSVSQDDTSSDAKLTRVLLLCSVIAGPLYVIVGVIETFTRPRYDPTRHDLSLMSNGDWGWVHISPLILTGLLARAGADGIRRGSAE